MKIVVIGGTGLIGSQVVSMLGAHGHEAVAASPSSGVNTLTGEGLAEAFAGADVVVDVTNSPSFADADVMSFFTVSTTNQLAAEKAAGVGHHVALSIVGAGRLPKSGYLRAKVAQEKLIEESGVPYSIIEATQFFEFAKAIADSATVDGVVTLPHGYFQPIAAADVATVVARTAAHEPLNGRLEIGGPEAFPMDDFIRDNLGRTVETGPDAQYFGTTLEGRELTPGEGAELSTLTYAEWAARA
jgi:uncharacterized protein YbjT (DUF2867 family)